MNSAADPDILAALTAIEARLSSIEAALQHRSPLSEQDQEKVDSLLPFLTSDAFTVRSLHTDALRTQNVPLAKVLDDIGSPRALGRLLARADAAGYRISRISAKPPALWRAHF